ncbi:MAG: hypothetical protein H7281_00505 [Bacteriovorax sp.]|nr:hypothetical protein [Bacteriovorax sp.]
MNGTIYEEIKKNGDSKKKEKLKFVVSMISSNILVAVLCLSFGPHELLPPKELIIAKILHPHFKMIVVPLNILIDLDPKSLENPVTLLNKSKKILIHKAYLHEMLISSNKDLESNPRFKIEIPEDEVLNINAEGSDTMVAIPELKLPEKVSKPLNKRVSQYEIKL